jgi:glutamyl-tRNA synthetase
MGLAMPVRVRYAPSPTGEPHVGNIRTALFDWLLARHEGGTFVLRIEDTDQARIAPGALETIYESLRWLGLDWDEGPDVGGPHGPYFQSERLEHYHRAARELIEAGHAYHCYCSTQRLEQMRADQMRRSLPPRYDRQCRNLSPEERREREAGDARPVVRFKTPLSGQTRLHDLVRSHVTFDNDTLDDFVILKSDGFPTYHLAAVVDDHLMEISHVLRGEEWLPSTPRHVLMYQAFGWQPPLFAHLPMILGPDRSKLSKRHGDTSMLEFRGSGFLPEALFNFLGLLGWSLDDKTEIISREEFVRHFGIERIVKNPAVFNLEKLTWMNGVYIRDLPPQTLADKLAPILEESLPAAIARPIDRSNLARIVPLVHERIKRLDEAPDLCGFFFQEGELTYPLDDLLGKRFVDPKGTPAEAAQALATVLERLQPLDEWGHEALEGIIRPLAAELGLKTGDLFGVIRVAVTGRTAAPPLFETMAVLGRESCLARLESAVQQARAAQER